uniref:Alpha-ketoglutarate-dependent dioxygenase AlkB-like domain-containing protein n=1 Tax=Ditylenchus dipsaci TaxID=166011 RepID=A0A915EVT2_9BILA
MTRRLLTKGGTFSPKGHFFAKRGHFFARRELFNMKLSLIRTGQGFFFFHNLEKWPRNLLNDIEANCFVKSNFITVLEEKSLMEEVEPKVKRLKYETSHWDDAIHLFRERKFSKWSAENEAVIQRILDASFPSSSSEKSVWSGEAHVLDLHKDGHIRPHIDSIRYCGEIVSGASLLSDCIMRLRHEKEKNLLVVDMHLPRLSLYKLSGAGRYEFTHEILPDKKSFFSDERLKVGRQRRISIICRDLPKLKDASVLEEIKFSRIPERD